MKTASLGIEMHPDFSNNTYSPTVYINPLMASSKSITTNGAAVNNIVEPAISASLSLSIVSTSTIIGVASYNLKPSILYVLPVRFYQIGIPLTCGLSPSVVISYSILPNSPYSVPNFVVFDSSIGSINFTVPSIGYDLEYSFTFYSFVASEGNSAYHTVYIIVIGTTSCGVENCFECEITDNTKCKTCNTGYSLSQIDNKSCVISNSLTPTNTTTQTSSLSSSAQTTALASAGAGAGISLLMSSLNLSSIAVLWAIFSQFRLLVFLILSDAYLPQSVIDYISGMKLFSFNFSFLSFQKLPVIKIPLQLFDFTQGSKALESIGLNSGSSLVNNINLAFSFLLLILFHIATFLESCQLIMISATSEISQGNTSSSLKLISLCLSVLIFIVCLVVWVWIFTLWIRKRKQKVLPCFFVTLEDHGQTNFITG